MLENNALTTLEMAKSYIGIDSTDTSQDEFLTFSINSASNIIEKHCSRHFGVDTYFESKVGSASTKLVLENYPIVDLASVEIEGQLIDITDIRILSEKGMIYRPRGGFPRKMQVGRFMHPRVDDPQESIFVEYQSGYVLPKDASDTNPRTLPYDLEMACLRMLRIMHKDREVSQGKNLILKREQIGDWMGEYEPENKNESKRLDYFDTDILAILDRYKRIVI
jgi:hypothetical protein